jgi:hypothetical protein
VPVLDLQVESCQPVGGSPEGEIWRRPYKEENMSAEKNLRQEFIAGLRAVAQFYEENPDAWYDGMHLTLNMYAWGRKARKAMADSAKAMGHCRKSYADTSVTVSRRFSEQVTLAIFAPRARLCRRIVVPQSRVDTIEGRFDSSLKPDPGN